MTTRTFIERVTVAVASLAAVLSSGCSLCDTSTLSSVPSPDRVTSAFVLSVGCGATVRDARQVTLRKGFKPPEPGIFESVVNEGTVFRIEGNAEIDVHWASETSVMITYAKQRDSDKVVRMEPKWDGIAVSVMEHKD